MFVRMPRRDLTDEGKALRLTLYANGHRPTNQEKWAVYAQIVALPGCQWYSRHLHSNWCSENDRVLANALRDYIVTCLHFVPNPTLQQMVLWANQASYDERQVVAATLEEFLSRNYVGPPGNGGP
ncbi:hypothetical protein BD310DRAFT_824074 [Dichomitus squalens]|uniref:Uncharacterized protein n=1 Tax=Dichomitus squalens TaxID=114155 RepID=A0A4Q9PPM9_9APHY|nr:hypothetical protein BD310DRAFT_824074 [Dichomitus squalens]